MKHSKPYTNILKTANNIPDGFFTHLFFASAIILIFSGVFFHRLSRNLIFNIKWLKDPTNVFEKQKRRNRIENPK